MDTAPKLTVGQGPYIILNIILLMDYVVNLA